MTRVSRDTFRNRLRFLLEDGNPSRSQRAARVKRIADQRGVSRATVNAWARGERAPSNNTRDRIRRQALRQGASRAVQTRENGRFGRSITNERAVRAVRAMQTSVARQRTANIRAARLTGSQARLEAAQADPIVSDEEIENLGRQYETLEERQRGMEPGQFMTWEGVVIEDWEAWRSSYEQIAG
tara:strand:+ start:3449 stop:4000 length:552 start_codon:yes stop_codon:yes gene_type:complete